MRRIVITEIEHRNERFVVYIGLNESRKIDAFQIFEPKERSMLGDICAGYVEKIASSVNAAFVRLPGGQKGYLPLTGENRPVFVRKQSRTKPLCEGDIILVQVTKDAVKTKDAVVSTKLTIHGSFCFLTTENTGLRVSKKLDRQRSEPLLALLAAQCADHDEKGYGMVFRTNAADQTKSALLSDIAETVGKYEALCESAPHRTQGETVLSEAPGYVARLKSEDMEQVDGICTDRPELYETIARALPHLLNRGLLALYRDESVSLSALYGIRSCLDQLLSKKVWLDSGANIIIETLETLTVIDVNSGKNVSGKPDALFLINLEAAAEIARQIRLRNISGMIVIDFISMQEKEKERALVSALKRELKKDWVPVHFVDITGLGLVELTRKKVYRSLGEILRK